jgi:hypothetical protein
VLPNLKHFVCDSAICFARGERGGRLDQSSLRDDILGESGARLNWLRDDILRTISSSSLFANWVTMNIFSITTHDRRVTSVGAARSRGRGMLASAITHM